MWTAIGAVGSIVVGALGLWLKYRQQAPAQAVAETSHAMLQDAANRPGDDATLDRLQHGKF